MNSQLIFEISVFNFSALEDEDTTASLKRRHLQPFQNKSEPAMAQKLNCSGWGSKAGPQRRYTSCFHNMQSYQETCCWEPKEETWSKLAADDRLPFLWQGDHQSINSFFLNNQHDLLTRKLLLTAEKLGPVTNTHEKNIQLKPVIAEVNLWLYLLKIAFMLF